MWELMLGEDDHDGLLLLLEDYFVEIVPELSQSRQEPATRESGAMVFVGATTTSYVASRGSIAAYETVREVVAISDVCQVCADGLPSQRVTDWMRVGDGTHDFMTPTGLNDYVDHVRIGEPVHRFRRGGYHIAEFHSDSRQTEFKALVEQWRFEAGALSSTSRKAEHPAYQQIIAMGYDAVPLLLEELRQRPSHWFVALQAITGVNPVREEQTGYVDRMAEAWIRWGQGEGYIL